MLYKNQNTHFVCYDFAVYKVMWKNIAEPNRPQMTIWRMHITCWIPKATYKNSEYVKHITFLQKQYLH